MSIPKSAVTVFSFDLKAAGVTSGDYPRLNNAVGRGIKYVSGARIDGNSLLVDCDLSEVPTAKRNSEVEHLRDRIEKMIMHRAANPLSINPSSRPDYVRDGGGRAARAR